MLAIVSSTSWKGAFFSLPAIAWAKDRSISARSLVGKALIVRLIHSISATGLNWGTSLLP